MNEEENKSFKIFDPLPDYTLPQIETIWKSETRKQIFTETYSYFRNPLHIITETNIRNIYHFFYGEEFEWHLLRVVDSRATNRTRLVGFFIVDGDCLRRLVRIYFGQA